MIEKGGKKTSAHYESSGKVSGWLGDRVCKRTKEKSLES